MDKDHFEINIPLHSFRAAALAVLALAGAAYVPGFLNWALCSVIVLSGFILGIVFAYFRLRVWVALLLCAQFILIFRLISVFILTVAVSAGITQTEAGFFLLDRNLVISAIPALYACFFSCKISKNQRTAAVEICCNALILLCVFWTQTDFQATIFPHPVILLVGIFLFLMIESGTLMFSGHRELIKSRAGIGFFILILVIAFLLSAVFFSFYSKSWAKSSGGLISPTMLNFDISRFLSLETDVSMSDELLFFLRTDGRESEYLVRRFYLSGYNPGDGFYVDTPYGEPGQLLELNFSASLQDPGYGRRSEIIQDYLLLNINPDSFLALDYPVDLTPMGNWQGSAFSQIYRTTSLIPNLPYTRFDSSRLPEMQESLAEYYTEYGQDEEIAELAESITMSLTGDYRKITAINDFLRKNYFYSLKPGIAPDDRQLRFFLFNSKKGYCTYFAYAMALLCRSAGIPARVAVGFKVPANRESGILGYYPVRSYMAHAWVEVASPDQGWIAFDPTTTIPAPGEEFSLPKDDSEIERMLIEELLRNRDSVKPLIQPDNGIKLATGQADQAGVIPLLIMLVLTFVILLPAIIRRLDKRRILKCQSQPEMMRLILLFLIRDARGLGLAPYSGELPVEWGERLAGCGFSRVLTFIKLCQKGMYAGEIDRGGPLSPEEVRTTLDLKTRLKKELIRKTPWHKRIMGYFHIWGAKL